MDPLSIIASSITVAGTVGIALKAIHHTYRAKPELLALLNEVTDVTAILREVERSLQLGQPANSQILGFDNSLINVIVEIKTKLQQLAEDASRWTSKPARTAPSLDASHLRWLRIALKVRTFRDDFRALRSKLKFILPALNM